MYSEQLESLIKSGIKAQDVPWFSLHVQASHEGVDLDELNTYVDHLIEQAIKENVTIAENYNDAMFNYYHHDFDIYYKYKKPYYICLNADAKNSGEKDMQIEMVFCHKASKQHKKQLLLYFSTDHFADERYFGVRFFNITLITPFGDILLKQTYCYEFQKNIDEGFLLDYETLKILCQSTSIEAEFDIRFGNRDKHIKFGSVEWFAELDKHFGNVDKINRDAWEQKHFKIELSNMQQYLQEFYQNAEVDKLYENEQTDKENVVITEVYNNILFSRFHNESDIYYTYEKPYFCSLNADAEKNAANHMQIDLVFCHKKQNQYKKQLYLYFSIDDLPNLIFDEENRMNNIRLITPMGDIPLKESSRFRRDEYPESEKKVYNGFLLEYETLRDLCHVPSIKASFLVKYYVSVGENVEYKEQRFNIDLIGFQNFLQEFYHNPEVEKLLEKETQELLEKEEEKRKIKEEEKRKIKEEKKRRKEITIALSEQTTVNLLCGKCKGIKHTLTAPYYIKRYYYRPESVTISRVKNRIEAINKEYGRPKVVEVSLHSLCLPDDQTKFYLCLANDGSHFTNNEAILAIGGEQHHLSAITKEKSYLNKKSKYAKEYFNFYPIHPSLLEKMVTTKSDVMLISTHGHKYIIKEKIPYSWQKAYNILSLKDGFEEWKRTYDSSKLGKVCLFLERLGISPAKFVILCIALLLLSVLVLWSYDFWDGNDIPYILPHILFFVLLLLAYKLFPKKMRLLTDGLAKLVETRVGPNKKKGF
jgi:hypothetical protein